MALMGYMVHSRKDPCPAGSTLPNMSWTNFVHFDKASSGETPMVYLVLNSWTSTDFPYSDMRQLKGMGIS